VAKQQGANLSRLAGTVQNDILKEYIARGTYIYPLRPAMRIVTDIFAWCKSEIPNWNAISISGYHIREAGSTEVQEVAFTLANAIAYVEAAIAAGLAVDDFAPQLSFFFNAHNEFLMQIAKFRAARRLWARTMRDRFKAQDPRSQMLRFHAQTAGSSSPRSSRKQRGRVACSACRGAGRLPIPARELDGRGLALPTESAALVALRHAADHRARNRRGEYRGPVAGSYAIEKLTNEIEVAAQEYIARIDAMEGMLRPSRPGTSSRRFRSPPTTTAGGGARRTNRGGSEPVPGGRGAAHSTLQIDPEIERTQVARLKALRARRDAGSRAPLSEKSNGARGK